MKQNKQNAGNLKPIVTAGLMMKPQSGVSAASGSKSQRTAIRHESRGVHKDASKLPQR